jgi:hypothetical protein
MKNLEGSTALKGCVIIILAVYVKDPIDIAISRDQCTVFKVADHELLDLRG